MTRLWTFGIVAAIVVALGLYARRWRHADLGRLDEWALGGRRLGTFLTWFLLGGDLYTAYTFIAVPALIYGAGAVGLFALAYTIVAFPVGFLLLPPLWRACREHGHLTVADLVAERHASRTLSAAVALTGVLATIPYIGLQIIGLELAFPLLGLAVGGFSTYVSLVLAFLLAAGFTFTSGLRAPVLIAVVKDLLVYVLVFVLVVAVPLSFGGWSAIFSSVPVSRILIPAGGAHDLGAPAVFATLAVGSALALFLYPHAVTGVLGAKSAGTVRRNMILLPAYSFVLGLLLLLGYAATVVPLHAHPAARAGLRVFGPDDAIPALMLATLPRWFLGVGVAALVAGALVPASVMAIAASNLVVCNLLPRPRSPNAGAPSPRTSRAARAVSLAVLALALGLVFAVPFAYAIDFQLLGGVLILQTLPAVLTALRPRAPRAGALFAGWLIGMASGTWFVASTGFRAVVVDLHVGDLTVPCYAAVVALLLNLLGVALAEILLRIASVSETHGRCGRSFREPGGEP